MTLAPRGSTGRGPHFALAASLGDEDTAKLRAEFEALDSDGNGILTVDEICLALEKGVAQGAVEIADALRSTGQQEFSYVEFIAATMSLQDVLTYDRLWNIFYQYDRSRDGKISRDELLFALSGGKADVYENAPNALMNLVDEVFEQYDADGSGEIDFDEFVQMLSGNQTLKTSVLQSAGEDPFDEQAQRMSRLGQAVQKRASSLARASLLGAQPSNAGISDTEGKKEEVQQADLDVETKHRVQFEQSRAADEGERTGKRGGGIQGLEGIGGTDETGQLERVAARYLQLSGFE